MSEQSKYKILIANGVNLDLLGRREPEIYGTQTLKDLEAKLRQTAKKIENIFQCSLELFFYQTNNEADYLDILTRSSWDACILNPGAWTHSSLALGDRLKGLNLRFIEVHLSHVFARDSIRHHSYLSNSALGTISGLGFGSYCAALFALVELVHP